LTFKNNFDLSESVYIYCVLGFPKVIQFTPGEGLNFVVEFLQLNWVGKKVYFLTVENRSKKLEDTFFESCSSKIRCDKAAICYGNCLGKADAYTICSVFRAAKKGLSCVKIKNQYMPLSAYIYLPAIQLASAFGAYIL